MSVQRETEVNLDVRLIHDTVARLLRGSKGVEQHRLIAAYSENRGVSERTAKTHLKLLKDVYLPKTSDAEIAFRKVGSARSGAVTWYLKRSPIAEAMGKATDMQEAAAAVLTDRDREFARLFGLSNDEWAAYKPIFSTTQFDVGSGAWPKCHVRAEVPIARFGLLEVGVCPLCLDAFAMPPRGEDLDRTVKYRDAWILLRQEMFVEFVRRMPSLDEYQARDRKAHRGLGRLSRTKRSPRRAGGSK